MIISLPTFSLVVLIGPSGVGKSTFARKHFRTTEILSSDSFRALVSDDEGDQSASKDAFEVLHLVLDRRLGRRRFTVVDATNLEQRARANLLKIAVKHACPAYAIVFDLAGAVCEERNTRRERSVEEEVIRGHCQVLLEQKEIIATEGFAGVHVVTNPEEMDTLTIEREPPPFDRRSIPGPFDLIGDVHGCFDELCTLLGQLGWKIERTPEGRLSLEHPGGRKLAFVGDLVDRGPRIVEVLRLVRDACAAGQAWCVVGNHDDKCLRHLRGNPVRIPPGLAMTLAQLEESPEMSTEEVRDFLASLPVHLILDEGRLVVAHAGLPEHLHGNESRRARDFALYGEVSGTRDSEGFPVRGDWGARYNGEPYVVYGHTPIVTPVWVNRTINIDTGCVFGGQLTALRYPEMELVSVPALAAYWERRAESDD